MLSLILKIFPFANAEIVSAALTCFFMTLLGLSLGFALIPRQQKQIAHQKMRFDRFRLTSVFGCDNQKEKIFLRHKVSHLSIFAHDAAR
jgi:hypothetical protein